MCVGKGQNDRWISHINDHTPSLSEAQRVEQISQVFQMYHASGESDNTMKAWLHSFIPGLFAQLSVCFFFFFFFSYIYALFQMHSI